VFLVENKIKSIMGFFYLPLLIFLKRHVHVLVILPKSNSPKNINFNFFANVVFSFYFSWRNCVWISLCFVKLLYNSNHVLMQSCRDLTKATSCNLHFDGHLIHHENKQPLNQLSSRSTEESCYKACSKFDSYRLK